MTAQLVADGYWASYNVPYFESISVHSGTAMACRLQRSLANNTDNCWADAPRANIFRERQGTLTSAEGLGDLLYYNDWKKDPLSQADPCKVRACTVCMYVFLYVHIYTYMYVPYHATTSFIGDCLSQRPGACGEGPLSIGAHRREGI